jgi:hypothetical protein
MNSYTDDNGPETPGREYSSPSKLAEKVSYNLESPRASDHMSMQSDDNSSKNELTK